MPRWKRTRRETIRRANVNGVLRVSGKLRPRKAAQRLVEVTRLRMLTPERELITGPPRPRPLRQRRVASDAPTLANGSQPEYFGKVGARFWQGAGTFGESLAEKLLDAVEPLYLQKLEEDERNVTASAIVRYVLRSHKIRATKVKRESVIQTPPHPLWIAISDSIPSPAGKPSQQEQRVANRVVESSYAAKDIRELLLFNGNLTLGRARAMFVFLSACMDAGLLTIQEITKASAVETKGRYPSGKVKTDRSVSDIAHFSGLHSPLQNLGIAGFIARINQTKAVWPLAPGIDKWVKEVRARSLSSYRFSLDPISRYSDRTRHVWRRRDKPARVEMYPYVVGKPTDEYGLVIAVHEIVPRGLPNELRADVCQELLVDILVGDLTLEQLQGEDGKSVIKKKISETKGHYTWSLDEPLRWNKPGMPKEQSANTLGDLIKSTDRHW